MDQAQVDAFLHDLWEEYLGELNFVSLSFRHAVEKKARLTGFSLQATA